MKLMVQLYLRLKFMPSIHVNRSMMLDYYRQNAEEFHTPGRVQMQIIAVPLSEFLDDGRPTAEEFQVARVKAQAVIEQAAAEIDASEDFGEVARKYSRDGKQDDGGLWPAMPRGSFRQKELEDAAFAMEEGQVSGVIETVTGFYIVKAAQVEPARSVSFEDAQDSIEEKLRQRQYKQITDEYFNDLVTKASIGNSGPLIASAADKAQTRFWGR